MVNVPSSVTRSAVYRLFGLIVMGGACLNLAPSAETVVAAGVAPALLDPDEPQPVNSTTVARTRSVRNEILQNEGWWVVQYRDLLRETAGVYHAAKSDIAPPVR